MGRVGRAVTVAACVAGWALVATAMQDAPRFTVLAFSTGVADRAHVSFVGEANRGFAALRWLGRRDRAR